MWTSILAIIANVTGFFTRRNVDKNALDVKEAKVKQDEVNERTRDTDAVVNRDVDEVRKRIAE